MDPPIRTAVSCLLSPAHRLPTFTPSTPITYPDRTTSTARRSSSVDRRSDSRSRTIVRSPEVQDRLDAGHFHVVIVYDQDSPSTSTLPLDSDVRLSLETLEKHLIGKPVNLFFLKGEPFWNCLITLIHSAYKISAESPTFTQCHMCSGGYNFARPYLQI